MTEIQHRHPDTTPRRRVRPGRPRRSRVLAGTVAVLVLLIGLLTVVGWMAPGGTTVARADNGSGDQQKVAVFEDTVIGPDETWDNVVVVGGDLLVRGTVENVIVVVFGDVTIAEGARVGNAVNPDDAAVVSVFGDVTVQSGATVRGRTVDVGTGIAGLDVSVGDPVFRPWRTGAILNWIWSTVFLGVVAVIITAIAPRQVAAVRDRVRNRFFSSLGWGALGAIIGVPLVTAALIISVIGIIAVVPWLVIALPIMSLFGLVAVGALVGRLIFGAKEDRRDTVMVAAVLGVVVINIARWIPVGWIVIIGVLWLVGFGATYVSIWTWLRDRRRRKREAAARERAARAAGAGSGGTPYPGGPYPGGTYPGGPPAAPSSPPAGPAPAGPASPSPEPPPAAIFGSEPTSGTEALASAAPDVSAPGMGTTTDAPTPPGSEPVTWPPESAPPETGLPESGPPESAPPGNSPPENGPPESDEPTSG